MTNNHDGSTWSEQELPFDSDDLDAYEFDSPEADDAEATMTLREVVAKMTARQTEMEQIVAGLLEALEVLRARVTRLEQERHHSRRQHRDVCGRLVR